MTWIESYNGAGEPWEDVAYCERMPDMALAVDRLTNRFRQTISQRSAVQTVLDVLSITWWGALPIYRRATITYRPVKDLYTAQHLAPDCVDDKPGQTEQHIVEVFGENDRPSAEDPDTTYGVLYVVAEGDLNDFIETHVNALEDGSYSVIDSYGYTEATE